MSASSNADRAVTAYSGAFTGNDSLSSEFVVFLMTGVETRSPYLVISIDTSRVSAAFEICPRRSEVDHVVSPRRIRATWLKRQAGRIPQPQSVRRDARRRPQSNPMVSNTLEPVKGRARQVVLFAATPFAC